MDWGLYWTILLQVGIAFLPIILIVFALAHTISGSIAWNVSWLRRSTAPASTLIYSTSTEDDE